MNTYRRPELDAFKGILISLIVLGHNNYFSRYVLDWFILIYCFHVSSFLLMPFLFRYDQMNSRMYFARIFRIIAPQVTFLLIVIPIYYMMFVVNHRDGAEDWFVRLPVALLFQTETQLKLITGFRHFWFLPSMALLISLLWLQEKIPLWVLVSCILVMAFWHMSAGGVDSTIFQYFPWGAAIVGFLFIPGLVVRAIYDWCGMKHEDFSFILDVLLVAIWLGLVWIVLRNRFFMPIAGDPYQLIFGLRYPARLLFQDLFLLVSFFTMLRVGWWLRGTVLTYIGRESLKIFLLSPLVWQSFWMAGGQDLDVETGFEKTALIVLSFTGTMTVSYGLARLIAVSPFQAIFFPKSPRDWWRPRRQEA